MINLEQTTPFELEQILYQLSHECYESDKAYIDAKEKYEILEDAKKPFLMVLMDKFNVKTMAEKERLAYASSDYLDWLNGYQQARREMNRARVERDSKMRLWETCRSILSSRNKDWSRQ